MKRRTVTAFFIALALYVLLGLLLMPLQKIEPHQRKTVTSLNLKKIEIKKALPQKPLHPQPIPPNPAPKKYEESKKRVKRKKNKPIKRLVTKKRIRHTEKNATKIVKLRPLKKRSSQKARQKRQTPSLAALFASSQSSRPPKSTLGDLPKEYRKLYKDEFDTFTQAQKRFLKDNLARIGYITQKYLYLRGYPYIAVKTRQQGTNVVEFYLHPNGDISGLRLIGSSGYEALDKNTIETIKAAYKDYPLPKETTKIRIYVKYRLIY